MRSTTYHLTNQIEVRIGCYHLQSLAAALTLPSPSSVHSYVNDTVTLVLGTDSDIHNITLLDILSYATEEPTCVYPDDIELIKLDLSAILTTDSLIFQGLSPSLSSRELDGSFAPVLTHDSSTSEPFPREIILRAKLDSGTTVETKLLIWDELPVVAGVTLEGEVEDTFVLNITYD